MAHHQISDLEYDIVVTISNLLEGREVLKKYAQDAEKAGDSETAELMRSIASFNEDMAMKMRGRLAKIIA